eukprot:g5033.t1
MLSLGLQLAVFALHGWPNSSEKFYDLSGSLTHFTLVSYALLHSPHNTTNSVFASVVSYVWMARLGSFLYKRILRDGKDGRFDHIKPVWLSFLGAWTIQALWVLLIQMPIILLCNEDKGSDDDLPSLGALCGMILWVLGFVVEVVADTQKNVFRDDPHNRHKFITHGLWRYSRHPNYFGEIVMWSALALIASVVAIETGDGALHWAWLSPMFTTFLLLKVSGVPMLERAGRKKWKHLPQYEHYMKHTSCVVPWFPAGPMAVSG